MRNMDIATGELVRYEIDLFLPSYFPLEITRSYASTADPHGLSQSSNDRARVE